MNQARRNGRDLRSFGLTTGFALTLLAAASAGAQAPSAASPEPREDPPSTPPVPGGSPSAEPAEAAPATPLSAPPADLPAAQTTDPAAAVPPASLTVRDSAGPPEGKKKKQKKNQADVERQSVVLLSGGGQIGFKGRVFALAELAHRKRDTVVARPGGAGAIERESFTSLDLSLPSARFSVEYQAPIPWISAAIEIDAADGVELKDGYVQARGKRFFARAGQFKVPTSAIELESPWALPLARRGLVNTLLTDWLDVAGRRPGFVAGVRGRGKLKPRLTLGMFQGQVQSNLALGDRDTDLIEEVSLEAQSYVARAQIELAGAEVGVWYEHRVGSYATNRTRHYFTAGTDVVFDRLLPGGGVRAWLDAIAGASWYVHPDKGGDDDATFLTGRALVGYRFGGMLPDAPYVEPFGFLAVLDPDLDISRDFAWEAALGVNVGYWQRARVTLQAEMNQDQRNFPNDRAGYLAGLDPDRLGLLLQVGVSF